MPQQTADKKPIDIDSIFAEMADAYDDGNHLVAYSLAIDCLADLTAGTLPTINQHSDVQGLIGQVIAECKPQS